MDKSRTKSRNAKTTKTMKTTSTRNIATQTVNSMPEDIVNLEKQVELLQLENDTLKEKLSILARDSDAEHVLSFNKAQEISKVNIKVTICGCKGNCSSRRCGCMRENNKCTASCKCNSEICQNQEIKDENEESDQQKMKSQISRRIRSTEELHQQNKENVFTNNMTTSKKQEENEIEEQFDPMKPRYQLSRTPPKMNLSVESKTIHMDNTYQSQLSLSPQIIASSVKIKDFSDTETIVDWMQHTAQLIPCKKCNRTFMPHRIKKHEACCKKI